MPASVVATGCAAVPGELLCLTCHADVPVLLTWHECKAAARSHFERPLCCLQ